ncbi:MAG: Rieske (2Fe-2S) protein [Actinobacteria bacterium]|nr:Rieske (2Fe-2S) protein [Actinomycetota bacterium]MBW3646654.1 Rieske (2Fe-2S) protein [Actinomycetota bacterium]
MVDAPCTRRALLTGGCLVAAAGIAGCASPASSPSESGSGSGGTAVAGDTAAVPIGGGRVFEGRVVVTQPSAGTFFAFSAACTHQGCTVSGVEDEVISCPCHGSRFDINDGSVVQGPASGPLARREIAVSGSTFTIV